MLLRWTLPLAAAVLLAVPASAADQSVSALPSTQWSPDDVTIDLNDEIAGPMCVVYQGQPRA